jgi:hypothetical protein
MKELKQEAEEALAQIWFLQSLAEQERTDITLSLRLTIRPNLFVQIFMGTQTHALYFSLIEDEQRIFGIDREGGNWHMHPYGTPDLHVPVNVGLEPRPLFTFLSRVEQLLWEHDLL